MHNNIDKLFENLWRNYISVTPTATKIHDLFAQTQKSDIINDHIALRTFNLKKVNLEKLAQHFKKVGYKECGEYDFEEKKLFAKHYEHPNSTQPKVFISELLVEKFPQKVQKVIERLVHNIDDSSLVADNFLYSGTHWSVDLKTYKMLLEQSEYAAWMAAWGYRANHFTISINHLEHFKTIQEVNQKLKGSGFALNSNGGEVKGSPEVLLEQSSTLADNFSVKFSDGELVIPSCFYEFALRYKKENGQLYTGFVVASANKIFESTNKRQA